MQQMVQRLSRRELPLGCAGPHALHLDRRIEQLRPRLGGELLERRQRLASGNLEGSLRRINGARRPRGDDRGNER